MPSASAQSAATLKAFATQPHTGPIEQALVGVETRLTLSDGRAVVRHGNGLVIRCDGFVLTSAALFNKPILSPNYKIVVTLHPGTQNEKQVSASIVMHEGMILRSFVGRPEPFVVLKVANVHTPALRLLLPAPLAEEPQVMLAWSGWDEQAKHFQAIQKRQVALAAVNPQKVLLNRLAFAQPQEIALAGAVMVGPEGMGVGLITGPVTTASSTFSTFATLNTTTNCITPQSVTQAQFVALNPIEEKKEDQTEAATTERNASGGASSEAQGTNRSKSEKTTEQSKEKPVSVPPAKSNALVAPDMVAVPGGPVQLPTVLSQYQSDMIGARIACVAPFLIDKYEVTNMQYYQFWSSLTPEQQKQNADAYYPVGWAVHEPPYPEEVRDVPVLGVRLAGAQAYAAWAGKRLPTPYEWCLAAFGPGGGTEMPGWVKRYMADKQATWQQILQAHAAFTQQFPGVQYAGSWPGAITLEWHLPWLFWYPFEIDSIRFSYRTVMEATAHLWTDWIDPLHVLQGGKRPFDVSPYGAYDMILNADELIMPYQAYRNRIFTPEDGSVKDLYMQVSFPGPTDEERNQVSGGYGPRAYLSWFGPGDIFQGYREPMLSRRLRGPANDPWQDSTYIEFLQVTARVREISTMMYTAMRGVVCLEPGPTTEATDFFVDTSPIREDNAGDMHNRYSKFYGRLFPTGFSGPVNTEFHHSTWYQIWRDVPVPRHREMGREANLNAFIPYNPNARLDHQALYLVPGGFRCVR